MVTLPHTGIRVPDATLQVASYQELPTQDGVAYTATVRWGAVPVGTIHNEGRGGGTYYVPAAGSALDRRRLAELVDASRGPDGQPLAEEDLFEELVTEYEHAEHVARAARAGRSAIHLRAPLGVGGDDSGETYYTAEQRLVAKVTTPADRAALTAQLQRIAVPDGTWWQLWTGEAWEDLTVASQPGPDRPDRR